MLRMICVEPAENGWAVRAEGFANDMLFISGAKAETAARKLARQISGAGEHTEIRIYLRDGSLAARFACAPFATQLAAAS